MNKHFLKLAAFVAVIFASAGLTLNANAADIHWTYPAIANYGPVNPLPHAAVQPKKDKVYKAVFDVTSAEQDASKPNPGLVHVARAVNVFASAGVPLEHLKFVAVIHGPATPSVLDNEQYHAKYGMDNPNIPLIAALREAGVKVQVCGQALADLKYDHDWVNKDVTITLSALADLIVYGDKGYAFVKQ